MSDLTALQNSVIAKITELTDGELFDDPAKGQGEKSALRIYKGAVPPKRSAAEDKKNFPFLAVRILSGSGGQNESMVTVILIGGLYTWTHDEIETGQGEVFRLLRLLLPLQTKRGFAAPFRLALPIKWHLGTTEDGLQDHPFYRLTMELPFRYAPLATSMRG